MNLTLWIPSLFNSKGGIQVYSNYLFVALRSLYPHVHFNIFLKHDTLQSLPSPDQAVKFHVSGQIFLPFRTLAFALQLISGISGNIQKKPNLIISTHLNFTLVAYFIKRFRGVPYWTIAHGIEAWNIQNSLSELALQNADLILAVSHYTRDRLLSEQNLDPTKVVVLPNTFDSDRFQIGPKPSGLLKKYGLSSEQPIILTVARLETSEKYKGYDTVLAALTTIRQAIPNVHYILVGKGGDRSRIQQLIAQYQIQDFVTLAGFISDEELVDYYNLCDVFAMPSKKEGFGIVYLEALACGKPTLGGNQDGAIDALCHGTLGALVNPDDIDEIAQTLIQILQGHYPNPLMYEPQLLRQKVIEIYGFEQFKRTLINYLTMSEIIKVADRN
jgi:glycosyltransferase involved in cell wall biosynthesis